MIEIKNVTFSYYDNINLSNFSLDIRRGQCVLLCGESGCGKTTVTRLINGLIPHFMKGKHSEGGVYINNKAVSEKNMYELAEQVGSVFQNPKSQFFHLDSCNELAFVLENRGESRERMISKLQTAVTELQIEDLMHRNLLNMSGGEKQIMAIASVYVGDPDIYVFDEPSSNLDEDSVERLRGVIRQICKQGKTVIIAEHRLHYLADIADLAVYIKDGEIKHCLSGEKIRQLTEERQIAMGLRSVKKIGITVPVHSAKKGAEIEGETCLKIRELGVKRKGKIIFSNLNLCVKSGEIVGITGKNGIGKSTLLRCLCGLQREYTGEILIEGERTGHRARASRVYMVMQDVNHQLFGESVWDECEMTAGENKEDEITEILTRFELIEDKDSHPLALSGGQKQRLVIATAILGGRKILLLDEPTSGLDYRHMVKVSRELKALAKLGYTILVVSHDNEFINAACDRCMEMK